MRLAPNRLYGFANKPAIDADDLARLGRLVADVDAMRNWMGWWSQFTMKLVQ